jgi:hypothetical protein
MKRILVSFGVIAVFCCVWGIAAASHPAAAADQTVTIGFTASQTGKFNV